ncbi:MAG: MBL fold metallo-hydrolase, partial [Kiritimatiellae bacterium]|nr:MBL fold metallo-hydrolase [Kiritimatiellia bacterium]
MASTFKLLFLGTGTSAGVPMIGCDCAVCRSPDPHNHRLRSSAYLAAGDLRILIDTSPDFREQALREGIRRIDATLITHAHVDHLFGLDDIRRINTVQDDKPMPLYASPSALDDIRRIFDYIFKPNVPGTYRPKLDLRPFEETISIPASDESDETL